MPLLENKLYPTLPKHAMTIIIHVRSILILLLLASLGAVLHSTRHLSHEYSDVVPPQSPLKQEPSIAFVVVVSMQRSAATFLLGKALAQGSPCAVSLNAIFVNSTKQSGNAWNHSSLQGSMKELEPSLLKDFLVQVGSKRCADKLQDDVNSQCHNKCIVGFKDLDHHLSKTQHEWIWKHTPNITTVVLERNVQDRWKSLFVAVQTGDWDTKGSYWHGVNMDKMASMIPPLNTSNQYCTNQDKQWRQLCRFEEKHEQRYDYVRTTLSNPVKVSFDDTIRNGGKAARDAIVAALPKDFQGLFPVDYHFDPEVALVAVASMRRSASTSLLAKVLVHENPCAVSLGDVFVNNTDKSEDAWLVEGKNLSRPIDKLEPSMLIDFLVQFAKRKCADRLMSDINYTCRNKCLVGFKEFEEHLSHKQHEYLWKHVPNMTVIVLERDLQARWKSRWVAAQTGDWDTTGSSQHKQVMKDIIVPPMNITETKEICNNDNYVISHLCHFERNHKRWYNFIRDKVPSEQRIEISFHDTILNDGMKAHEKIESELPYAFRYLATARERTRR